MARVRADDASEDDKVFIKEPYMQDMQPFLGSNRKGVCDFLLNMTVQRGAVCVGHATGGSSVCLQIAEVCGVGF